MDGQPLDLLELAGSRKLDLYRQLYTIRRVEESLLALFSQGLLSGTVHTCIGQEACGVGVVNALDRTRDVIWSNHRSHGHFLAYSDDMEGLLAEILGKSTGVCGGIGGSQHLHTGAFYSNGVLGGTIPCAVGSAWAEKLRGTGAIGCVFLGDGAMAEGAVYEGLNMASLWNVPLLFVLEHNGQAQSTPTRYEHVGSFEDRVRSFDIEVETLNADEVMVVLGAATRAVKQVRRRNRPLFLILHTHRLCAHSKGDDHRPEEELQEIRRLHDPVANFRQQLMALDPSAVTASEAALETRLQQAIVAAQAAHPRDSNDFFAGGPR